MKKQNGFGDIITIAVIAVIALAALAFGGGCRSVINKYTDGMSGKNYSVGDTPAFAADDVPFDSLVWRWGGRPSNPAALQLNGSITSTEFRGGTITWGCEDIHGLRNWGANIGNRFAVFVEMPGGSWQGGDTDWVARSDDKPTLWGKPRPMAGHMWWDGKSMGANGDGTGNNSFRDGGYNGWKLAGPPTEPYPGQRYAIVAWNGTTGWRTNVKTGVYR